MDLDVELPRVVIALSALERALHHGALCHGNGLPEEEGCLLPVRGLRRRPRAEARHLRAAGRLALERVTDAHAPRLVRPPAERPDFGQDRVAILDDVDARVRRDGLPGGGEEGVEVEHEGAHFDAPLRGRNEFEGGGKVELLLSDVSDVDVLLGRPSAEKREETSARFTFTTTGLLRTVLGPTTSTIASS